MPSLQVPRTNTISSRETTRADTPGTLLPPDATIVDHKAPIAKQVQDNEVSPLHRRLHPRTRPVSYSSEAEVSDLYSAKTAFSYGFVPLEILELIISFLPDIYLFFVNCTLSGIASTTHELGTDFTLYGMPGALANVAGIIIAGFIDMATGQKPAWRFFFRLLVVMILPAAVASLYCLSM
ncbi:hypothetical protein JCM24511_10076 [Saitozyma sp. JCM 24511]|nr:hypothetical protein JCM24511_10076 [Saitozyma sp. JCM 24511]